MHHCRVATTFFSKRDDGTTEAGEVPPGFGDGICGDEEVPSVCTKHSSLLYEVWDWQVASKAAAPLFCDMLCYFLDVFPAVKAVQHVATNACRTHHQCDQHQPCRCSADEEHPSSAAQVALSEGCLLPSLRGSAAPTSLYN